MSSLKFDNGKNKDPPSVQITRYFFIALWQKHFIASYQSPEILSQPFTNLEPRNCERVGWVVISIMNLAWWSDCIRVRLNGKIVYRFFNYFIIIFQLFFNQNGANSLASLCKKNDFKNRESIFRFWRVAKMRLCPGRMFHFFRASNSVDRRNLVCILKTPIDGVWALKLWNAWSEHKHFKCSTSTQILKCLLKPWGIFCAKIVCPN